MVGQTIILNFPYKLCDLNEIIVNETSIGFHISLVNDGTTIHNLFLPKDKDYSDKFHYTTDPIYCNKPFKQPKPPKVTWHEPDIDHTRQAKPNFQKIQTRINKCYGKTKALFQEFDYSDAGE